MERWRISTSALGLLIVGCSFFKFPAPERMSEGGGGGTSTGGKSSSGGTSGVSGTNGTTGGDGGGGAAGDDTSGGGATSGAAGAGDGGMAGAADGGTSGSATGGTSGSAMGGMSGSAMGGMSGSAMGGGGSGGMGPPLPVTGGLRLWLDASSLTSEGPLATWPNQVEDGESDATQPELAQRPVLATVDARPGVTFDGTQWMTFAEGFENFSAGLTLFIVAKFDDPGICKEIFQVSNGLEVDDISFQTHVVNGPGALLFEVEDPIVFTGPGVIGGPNPALATVVVTPPGSATIFLDTFTAAMRTDPLLLPEVVARTQNFLGSGLYLNCDPFDGVIHELLLYNRGLTPENVALVNTYLQQKWRCCGE